MSGLEVIGVVASASQLVRYLLEIIDYTQRIWTFAKGVSCPFQQHRENLESLISAVETIRQTSFLQTDIIESYLKALLDRTQIVRATLKRYSPGTRKFVSKIGTALQAPKAETKVLKDLASIERDKSNLLLHITSSYAKVLYEIKAKMNSDAIAKESTSKASTFEPPLQREEQSTLKMNSDPTIPKESTPKAIIFDTLYQEFQKPTSTLGQSPEPCYEKVITRVEPRTYTQASTSAQTSSASSTFTTDDKHIYTIADGTFFTTLDRDIFPVIDGHIFRFNQVLDAGSANSSCGSEHKGKGRDTLHGNNTSAKIFTTLDRNISATDGNIFHANQAHNGGFVVNSSCGSEHKGKCRDTFHGNNANGKDSRVLNGQASGDLIKAMLELGISPVT